MDRSARSLFSVSGKLSRSFTGRPIGSRRWLEDMQGKIGQRLIVERPGPKSRVQGLLRDCCNCHGNPFKLDDPAINMVHRPHYSPKTTLDGKFNLREIAAQAIKCLDDLS